MNENIRPPAVAGMFYTGEPELLASEIAVMLAQARPVEAAQFVPKALIVPHAGHIYSGPIAASAYALLAPAAKTIRRVVMFGPAHRVAVEGLALPAAESFATPLGLVSLDLDAMRAAQALPQVSVSAAAHATEHSLEVQLPFLQGVLDEFSLVPFVVGHTRGHEVAEVIDLLWGGPETLIVISSDLSHYLPYASAREKDQATTASILRLAPLTEFEQACGALPINGLIEVAQQRGLTPTLLDLRNSGDTAGDRARVVGYASFAFQEHGHVVH
ncbi:MAG: AmmeMemoRadiSam system protein B [Gammaproteobacteria bacterium]|nr:AmmeMemoRadiSam system protein B [Gammaproteobacteria bacterium]MBU1646722.1 AmmeMemoRadiSam system protein B [Gammaproteobacteria bacterium]MBU1971755.1 AmmeMemoRadiSam system protein B [Gammaproteobacteria bacterium]